MLVFFILLAFVAEGLCQDALAIAPCGENQVPSDCADDYCDVPTAQVCRPGCSCVEGYTRNSYNQCVPIPPLLPCGKNEEPTVCRQTCPPQTCDWDPNLYACKPGPCQPGCNCKKGYLRDQKEKCILQEKCPPILPQCGENEEPTDCAKNIRPGDSTLTIKCNPCQCIKNYVRDSKGICVRSPTVCGPFEEPNFCIAVFPNNCAPCRCIRNYVRNSKGECVPNTQPQCGKNEVPNECSIIYPRQYQTWEPSTDVAVVEAVEAESIRCRPCRCADGFVRDANDVCVPICGPFEEPNFCIAIYPSNCPPCRCIANYVRNRKGLCVPNTQPQCGKNEVPNECSIVYLQPILPLGPSTDLAAVESIEAERIRCRPCRCADGYVRDANDVCVPMCGPFEEPNYCIAIYPSNCPKCRCIANYVRNSKGVCVPKYHCGRNETYVPCIVPCPTNYCPKNDNNILVQCLVPNPCPGGCACKSNYTRTNSGDHRCILITDCPPIKCRGKNTVYNSCPSACFSDQCGTLQMEPTTCNTLVPNVCRPRCVCRKHYRRDSSGNCIHINQCPPQCGENEEPNHCPIYYPQAVEGSAETAVISVEAERTRCRPCKCIDGFIRDISDRCVPKPVCGENEVSTNCKQTCPPQDCTWDPTRMDCRPLECKPGCNCIEGHLRDENGKCIPREQCRECNGDPNAVYSQCPNQCVSTCKCPNAICSQECGEPFGCKCRLGYIRSEEGRCILPTECPGGNPCGRNETFAPCLIGCPTNNCPRDDSLAVPQCLPPFPCPGGCACKSNYKRISSENRRCILVTDCPPFKCRGNNTVYNSCPSACFSDQCGTLQMEPTTCNTLVPNVCRPRCVCREDHRRNSSGDCIPIKQCPPVKCPKNEYLNPCPSACFGDGCGELDEETAPCNTLVEHVCRPRCMCRKGYQRDGSGNCIPKAKCPVPS
ncbi:kielin/chordin-like protein isoform X2 [Maniola hyperantus]|uniref:kielin/chordin-like protein isoform X2 n=1 Tax=Aphantopus hyperantus TaxID=2795564 RepID=UPI00374A94C5